MDFAIPTRRRRAEPVVPMINVVFLLLVFFLMTATLAPPDPFDTRPPEAGAGAATEAAEALFVGADGALGFGAARDAAALALAARAEGPLLVRADARLPAAELAAILVRLTAAGVTDIRLVAVPR